ncbi:unnamed protein product [Fusarium graminearum]|nr:unnamed protein product [Fusarium graminearum]
MRFRSWVLVVLLLCAYVATAADSTTCSATRRCAQGCCNKSGNCGFGPDYCGKSVCRSDCDRLSECNPGFGSAWAQRDKCPLNVCCSKHGYCGTTKDFCGSKTVKCPNCRKVGNIPRVVGYFEGWAKNRACEVFMPEQIPIGLYTHINFAFGTINPFTYVVEANDEEGKLMYERLIALKRRDRNLKIFLAIGGWTFNDPGRTHKVFSNLVNSEGNQQKFLVSLMSFMALHKFDGLDLDWEYPVDKDRGGMESDYENFPKFMSNLKDLMEDGDRGLTITLPASYWYLQYFDIKKLERTVDFFNIMSYDLHGVWDQHANWTKPYLNAHTNLTEIDSALDLFWRNDIDPDKIVMGLGFYGRAFMAKIASCVEPGCQFNGPANAGKCSAEKGILLNSEIEGVIKDWDLTPKLYKEEAVKLITWGREWASYDDAETLKLKVNRAEERCLGGVMVWAITHDTRDAKYNLALADVLGRNTTKGSLDQTEDAGKWVKTPYEQCRWANCREGCPKGWKTVPRSDSGARKGEQMFDETGCGGDGGHLFCCPADEDTPSMKVYGTCKWGEYPECDASPDCPYEDWSWPLASSSSGSGGGKCNDRKNELGTPIIGVQARNYCCKTDPDMRFIDCEVRRDIGPYPKDEPIYGFCRSGCPSDRIFKRGSSSTDLVARDGKIQLVTSHDILTDLIALAGPAALLPKMRLEWNTAMRAANYTYLQMTYISRYIRENWILEWEGPSDFAREILCQPAYWAKVIRAWALGDTDPSTGAMNCTYAICDVNGKCLEDDDEGEGPAGNERRHANLFGRHATHLLSHSHHHHRRHTLQPRIVEPLEVTDPDDTTEKHEYAIEIPDNPTAEVIAQDEDNPLLKNVYQIWFPSMCWVPKIRVKPFAERGARPVQVEHLVDKNILKKFFISSALGKLRSGTVSKYGPIPIAFWDRMEQIDLALEPGVPDLPGSEGGTYQRSWIMDRAFECLGSARNDQVFVLIEKIINDAKNKVFREDRTNGVSSIKEKLKWGPKTPDKVKQDKAMILVTRIRDGFAAFLYINSSRVQLRKIVRDIYLNFQVAENVYNKKYKNEADFKRVQLADYWVEWIVDYFDFISNKFKRDVRQQISEIRAILNGVNEPIVTEVLAHLASFADMMDKNPAQGRVNPKILDGIKDDDTEMGGT